MMQNVIFIFKRLVTIIKHSCKLCVLLFCCCYFHFNKLILKIFKNKKRRKSISGGWKSNIGSAVLEQIAVTDKYKLWADEVANLFGGLDLVTIEIVETKSNEQFIYEVTGSQMTLMGETQEEDRRLISELITIKMQQAITQSNAQIPKRSSITSQLIDSESGQNSPLPQQQLTQQPQQTQDHSQFTSKPTGFLQRMGSISGSIGNTLTSVASNTPGSSILTNKFGSNTSMSSDSGQASSISGQVTDTVDRASQQIRGLFRRSSQTANEDGQQLTNSSNATNATATTATATGEDTEDTMMNLRKTFAGIFGEN